MTTWTTISNAAVAVGGIPSSATVTALRDNPAAIAEAASGAPVVAAGWHPVDKVTVGDVKDGLIYNSAVNGTVAEVETPNFEDGYEYRIIAQGISPSTTAIPRLALYASTSASWKDVDLDASVLAAETFFCDVEILMPRLSAQIYFFRCRCASIVAGGGSELSTVTGGVINMTSSQKVGKAKIIFSTGNIDAGKTWLFRRREYASSP